MRLFKRHIILLVFACVALCGAAHAEQNSAAVAATNLELSTGAGVVDNNGKAFISGKLTVPLTHSTGFQIDGVQTTGAGTDHKGIGGHVFYRDPSRFLIGATGMWMKVGDENVTRFGPEAEIYAGKMTFRASGGWQNATYNTGYANTKATYYATDNLALSARAEASSDTRGGGLDVEWQPYEKPFSVFASGGDSNDSSGYLLVGLRVTFGAPDTTLKERHRHYDPPNIAETFSAHESGGMNSSSGSGAASGGGKGGGGGGGGKGGHGHTCIVAGPGCL